MSFTVLTTSGPHGKCIQLNIIIHGHLRTNFKLSQLRKNCIQGKSRKRRSWLLIKYNTIPTNRLVNVITGFEEVTFLCFYLTYIFPPATCKTMDITLPLQTIQLNKSLSSAFSSILKSVSPYTLLTRTHIVSLPLLLLSPPSHFPHSVTYPLPPTNCFSFFVIGTTSLPPTSTHVVPLLLLPFSQPLSKDKGPSLHHLPSSSTFVLYHFNFGLTRLLQTVLKRTQYIKRHIEL